jgi:hypothetical protein
MNGLICFVGGWPFLACLLFTFRVSVVVALLLHLYSGLISCTLFRVEKFRQNKNNVHICSTDVDICHRFYQNRA